MYTFDRTQSDEEPDFSMVGSGLLGGSNYVPVTKEEREKFIAGVEIRAKYVGAIEVPEPRGEMRPCAPISEWIHMSDVVAERSEVNLHVSAYIHVNMNTRIPTCASTAHSHTHTHVHKRHEVHAHVNTCTHIHSHSHTLTCKGIPMMITAISRVRAQHKLGKEKKPKMRFVISTTGLRVYDEKTQLLRDTHQLRAISSIATLPQNRKVRAWPSRRLTNIKPRVPVAI